MNLLDGEGPVELVILGKKAPSVSWKHLVT